MSPFSINYWQMLSKSEKSELPIRESGQNCKITKAISSLISEQTNWSGAPNQIYKKKIFEIEKTSRFQIARNAHWGDSTGTRNLMKRFKGFASAFMSTRFGTMTGGNQVEEERQETIYFKDNDWMVEALRVYYDANFECKELPNAVLLKSKYFESVFGENVCGVGRTIGFDLDCLWGY